MDCPAKFPPLLPEIKMSYKYRFEKKVYWIENITNKKLGIFYYSNVITILTCSKLWSNLLM